MSSEGPFAPHPADAGQVEVLGERIARHGSRAATVGRTVALRGRSAGTADSVGLLDPILEAVNPASIAGNSLQGAGKVAALAMSAWAGAVRGYNRQIRDLNAEWQAAKANDFGVGGLELDRSSMKPVEVEQAASDREGDIADARAVLWADLVRRQQRAKRGLDSAADGVAALLKAGPDALDTALAGVGVSGSVSLGWPDMFGTGPIDDYAEEFQSLQPGSPDALGAMGNYDGNPVDWMETLAFLLGDPRECVGDDASVGGCSFEVATLIPWFKPFKAAKIAKYARRANDAGDAATDAAKAADEITRGHAYAKHINEFRGLGITTRVQFARHVEDVVQNPSVTRDLERGRTAYWDADTGTVVIKDPSHPDGGTAFIPRRGYGYFRDNLK